MKTETLTETNSKNFLTEEEILKLPKWGQIKIKVLQMRLREAYKEINQLKDAPESNTVVGYNFVVQNDEPPLHYLKNNQLISFKLRGGTIQVRIDGDLLDINTRSEYSEYLSIFPSATNSIQLGFNKKTLK